MLACTHRHPPLRQRHDPGVGHRLSGPWTDLASLSVLNTDDTGAVAAAAMAMMLFATSVAAKIAHAGLARGPGATDAGLAAARVGAAEWALGLPRGPPSYNSMRSIRRDPIAPNVIEEVL